MGQFLLDSSAMAKSPTETWLNIFPHSPSVTLKYTEPNGSAHL